MLMLKNQNIVGSDLIFSPCLDHHQSLKQNTFDKDLIFGSDHKLLSSQIVSLLLTGHKNVE